ncbi:MAG: SIS domain-containing protein [Clostridiales bacterium]|nr:SIS domain-containing protein [Clostridiales bacterium]
MDKKDYSNSVTRQVQDLISLAAYQTEKSFDLKKLCAVLPQKEAEKIRRVMLLGCGDSYSAVGAMLPGFKKLSGLSKCDVPDIMDFCRFYSEKELLDGYQAEAVLVVAISASGSSGRVAEAFGKADNYGAKTLLITNTPDSVCGKAAGYIYNLETPTGRNTPGLRSYYASMTGIAALGAYLGLCNGSIDTERFGEVKKSVEEYTLRFLEDIERIDDLMFAEAIRMKNLNRFEVIADGNEGFSAQFVEEKFIECGGVYCDHTNSEEFAHISFFMRGPDEVGTIVMINEADPSIGRMKDTIAGCLTQHRPTLVVTDSEKESFAVEADMEVQFPDLYHIAQNSYNSRANAGVPVICRIAKAPERWMSPFVDFIPGALLAGYQAAVNEKLYFGGHYDFREEKWMR